MKTTLNILFQLFIILSLNAQTIFDIQVDNIFITEDDIYFVNQGEEQSYECGILSMQQRDYHYNFALECEEGFSISEDFVEISFDEIPKLGTPLEFQQWIKNKRFYKEATYKNKSRKTLLQLYSEHFISKFDLINISSDQQPNWQFKNIDFWDYVYFRINREFLVLALTYEDDAGIGGLIIPSQNGAFVFVENKWYKTDDLASDSIDVLRHFDPQSFFRMKEVNGKLQIWDKLFLERILVEEYDEVKHLGNFTILKNENKITIYDKTLKNKLVDDVKVAYFVYNSIQFLKNNRIQWLDEKGKFHDSFPVPFIGVCGTVSSTERKIFRDDLRFYESRETGYGYPTNKTDSFYLVNTNNIDSITYLNNQSTHKYDGNSGILEVFSFPYNTYLVKSKSIDKLINITYKRDEKEKDSKSFKTQPIIKTEFSGKLEAFGYQHPVLFQQNGLFGYFPQNKKAKYKNLSKFDFYFATFELANGEKGWLDVNGNEYLEE